ncbi:MAG: hypothetical protein JWM71_904 [Solirubrobacteraceae bacterium]|nr:hypothetical protein [Solirubrobacteraceae bacterium]
MLLVDIDGVVSLFGFDPDERPPGSWHIVEGIAHFLSSTAAAHLHELAQSFDPVWCSGWEERADENLPVLLGAPVLPHLSFDRNPGRGHAHWKLAAIEAHVGDRPLAWIDDALDDACEQWAAQRAAPTLLVRTDPRVGLTADQVSQLHVWAGSVATCSVPQD